MGDMTAAEVLAKARDVLAEQGWYQGALTDPCGSGAVCSYGAIRVAALGSLCETLSLFGPTWEAVDGAEEALLAAIEDRRGIARWNDDPSRTYEDVLLAFKQAEELAQESAA